jgi:predicted transcriptional regulator
MYIYILLRNNNKGDKMIENIMSTDIIIMDIGSTICEVSEVMRDFNIGFMPISDGQKIVGVITDRDVVIKALANNCDANTKIDDYITRNIASIEYDEDIKEAIELMGKERIKRLLVTDENRIVGVLSLSDIINNLIDEESVMKAISRIWHIENNIGRTDADVDDFYL